MAIVYSENVIEVALIHTQAGRPCVNVLHMRDEDAVAAAALEDLARDLVDNWQDHMLQLMSTAVVFEGAEWRSLDPDDSSVGTLAPDPTKPTAGTRSVDAAPPNVAYLVHKRTASRPRGRRDGRIYLPGVQEAAADARGALPAAHIDLLQPSLDSFYNGISDTGIWNVEEHYPVVLETTPESRAPGAAPVVIDSRRVTAFVLDPLVATQRDRLR